MWRPSRPTCSLSCHRTRWRARPFVEHPIGNGPYRWVRRRSGPVHRARGRYDVLPGPARDRPADHSLRRRSRRPAQPAPLGAGRRDGQRAAAALQPAAGRGGPGPPPGGGPVADARVSSCSISAPGATARGPIPSWPTPTCAARWSWRSTARSWCEPCSGSTAKCRSGPPRRCCGSATARARRSGRIARRRRGCSRRAAGPTTMATGCSTGTGVPLALSLSYPVSSAVRRTMAQLIQEQYRQIGIRVDLAAVRVPRLRRAPRRRRLRHRLLLHHPGSLAFGAHPELDLRGRHQPGSLLRSGGGFPIAQAIVQPGRHPHDLAAGAAAHRAGRPGSVHLRADLRVRGEPALPERDDPAGVILDLALALVGRPGRRPEPGRVLTWAAGSRGAWSRLSSPSYSRSPCCSC